MTSEMEGAIAEQSDKDWQAEQDLRTLIYAESIKTDPKRLKAAMSMKKKLVKALDKAGE